MKVLLNSREWKLAMMCEEYMNDPFGSPNHLFMTTIGKFMEHVHKVNKIPIENSDDYLIEIELGKE